MKERKKESDLYIRPCELKEANAFVAQLHRHNKPVNGHKFSLKLLNGDKMVGCAIVGRPVSRYLDDGETLEIRRVCTDGTENACSKLYGACCRVCKELGYRRVITYTLQSEPGTSLIASNWKQCGTVGGGSWNCESRPRQLTQTTLFGEEIKYSTETKIRWERTFF